MTKRFVFLTIIVALCWGAQSLAQTPFGADCYRESSFLPDRGIAIGQQALVTRATTLRTDLHTFAEEVGAVAAGDRVTIVGGPVCFWTRNANNRGWHVRTDSGAEGIVYEYSETMGVVESFLTPLTPDDLHINHFYAGIPSAFGRAPAPGEAITLSWDVSGHGLDIRIIQLNPYQLLAQDLAANGSLTYTVPDDARGMIQFYLRVAGPTDAGNRINLQSMQVQVYRPDVPSVTAPITTDASYQVFERGVMLWRADTRQIYVLPYESGYRVYADTWQGEAVNIADVPPAGLLIPQLGFGKVWATYPDVAAALGWALSAEIPYVATIRDGNRISLPTGALLYLVDASQWRIE